MKICISFFSFRLITQKQFKFLQESNNFHAKKIQSENIIKIRKKIMIKN